MYTIQYFCTDKGILYSYSVLTKYHVFIYSTYKCIVYSYNVLTNVYDSHVFFSLSTVYFMRIVYWQKVYTFMTLFIDSSDNVKEMRVLTKIILYQYSVLTNLYDIHIYIIFYWHWILPKFDYFWSSYLNITLKLTNIISNYGCHGCLSCIKRYNKFCLGIYRRHC